MKIIPILALVTAIAACSNKDEPMGHIYRYPPGTEPSAVAPATRSVRGVVFDYHNHALPKPDEGQRCALHPGAFLLVEVAGCWLSS